MCVITRAGFSDPFDTEEYHSDEEFRDVYLGGSSGDLHWRGEIAIPTLRFILKLKLLF